MRQFTKEELDRLSKYADRYDTASRLGYARNLEPRYLAEIKMIYDDATGGNYGLQSTCGHCVIAFLKTVAKKYYQDLEAYNKKAEKMVEVLDEVFGDVPENEEPTPQKSAKPAAKKPQNKKPTQKKK